MKFLYLKFVLVFLVGLSLLGCQRTHNRHWENQLHRIALNDSINTIVITNEQSVPVEFSMKINNQFPLDFEDIETTIKQIAQTEKISKEQAAYLYVKENTFQNKPFTDNSWQHEPLLFLNSIGGGFCDDRASVLAQIWKKQGYQSRIIGLEGHIVPEVYVNNKWHMYDPDCGVFYCDSDGSVFSVAALENFSEKIFHRSCSELKQNPAFQNKNPLSERYASYYASKDNNKNITASAWNYKNTYSSNFFLPSYSALEIQYDEKKQITNIRVKLNRNSQGELQIPLVPYKMNGTLKATINEEKIAVKNSEIKLSEKEYISKIVIEQVTSNSEVHYLVNPKLLFIQQNNLLEIKTSSPLMATSKQSSENSTVLFGGIGLFFNLTSRSNQLFLENIAEYRGEEIDLAFLRQQYNAFLLMDSSLSTTQQKKHLDYFDNDIQEALLEDDKQNMAILKQHYPISVFYLFLALKARNTTIIKQKLSEYK